MSQTALLEPAAEAEAAEVLQIVFEIFGRQSPQGSKLPQPIYKKGGDGKPVPVMKNGRVICATRDASKNLLSWRGAVIDAARRAYDGPLLTGAVELEVTFYRPRPKGHFGTGRNAGQLKPSAPQYPLPAPDNTKLRRAIEDSLKGVVYHDDSQIVDGHDHKRYGDRFQTVICVASLFGQTEERF